VLDTPTFLGSFNGIMHLLICYCEMFMSSPVVLVEGSLCKGSFLAYVCEGEMYAAIPTIGICLSKATVDDQLIVLYCKSSFS